MLDVSLAMNSFLYKINDTVEGDRGGMMNVIFMKNTLNWLIQALTEVVF